MPTPAQTAAAIRGDAPPTVAQPKYTTINDVGHAYATGTLKKPNPYMPKWMTGALPHALLLGGLGALGGRYILPHIAHFLNPNLRLDRLKTVGGVAGGLLGAGLAYPHAHMMFQAARGQYDDGSIGPWTRGFKGLFGGLESLPPKQLGPRPMEKQQSFQQNDFWDGRTIDVDAMTDATVEAVYNGQMSPASAIATIGVAERSRQLGTGHATPASMAGAAGNALLRAGVGAGMGYGIGRVIGALGGAFGALGPKEQKQVGRTGALVGAIGNMLLQ